MLGDSGSIDRQGEGGSLEGEDSPALLQGMGLVRFGVVNRQELHAARLELGRELAQGRQDADAWSESDSPEVKDDHFSPLVAELVVSTVRPWPHLPLHGGLTHGNRRRRVGAKCGEVGRGFLSKIGQREASLDGRAIDEIDPAGVRRSMDHQDLSDPDAKTVDPKSPFGIGLGRVGCTR